MLNNFLKFVQKNTNKKCTLSESTKKILEEDNINILETDSSEEILNKVKKSKKVVAKIDEKGKVVIKQSLNG